MSKALVVAFFLCFFLKTLDIALVYYLNSKEDSSMFNLTKLERQKIENVNRIIQPEDLERFGWERILEPCKNDLEWKYRTSQHDERQQRTSGPESIVVDFTIGLSGHYSKFILQSRTINGIAKNVGGDFWVAFLTGTAEQNGIVYDRNDGTYEIWVFVDQPGDYELNLVLEYSQCDGLRDPPTGWFERGNQHGRFQEDGILGYLDDYLVERSLPFLFEVKARDEFGSLSSNGSKLEEDEESQPGTKASCYFPGRSGLPCSFVWDGYGKWRRVAGKYNWTPNRRAPIPANFDSQPKLETLWLYGDSLTYRFWDSSSTRVLCRKAFKKCRKTYNWMYKIDQKGESKVPINTGVPFNRTRFFEPLHEVLGMPEMQTNRSALVINFGLHIIAALNFSQYQRLLDELVSIVDEQKIQKNQSNIPHFIWKTTTLSHKENSKILNVTHARFITNHRVSLFNAYTNYRLCLAGITIFDVYPISASFTRGTIDHVHYKYFVFEPAEDGLAAFLWKEMNT